MVRVRNLVLAIAAATALTSKTAFALGLGEVDLRSSLNQPLLAEIELLDSRSVSAEELKPALASIEDFNKVGVDRAFFLTDLKFTPVRLPDGRHVIRVTSSKPMREPYLNFLVEVLWPNGRLLREYTLLLDPPLYSPETVARVAPQLPVAPAAPAPAPRVQAPAPAPAAPRPAPAPVAAPSTPSSRDAGSEYRVSPRDTLWEIASRLDNGASVHQNMLAIVELNPGAFVGGNINRMKSGQVLRLPGQDEATRRSRADALAEVAAQNAAWRQARVPAADGARQVDATTRNVAEQTPTQRDSRDSLRLVAADAGTSTAGSESGSASSESASALKDQLAAAQESLDSSRRENIELQDRMQDLQAQLDKLQRLMQLKDEQLAKLQGQMAGDAPVAGAQPDESVEPPVADEGADSSAANAAPAQQPEAQVEQPAEPQAEAAPVEPEPAATPAPAAAEPPKAKPAPVPAAPSLVDSLLDNPLTLAAGGGALILLLLGLLVHSRRKAMKEAEAGDEAVVFDNEPQDGVATIVEPDFAELLGDTEARQAGAAGESRPAPSATDVLAEADVFIAYGRFTQAAELLQSALNEQPERRDLRLKLMEVRAEMGDRDAFLREEAELREIGGSEAEIERLRAKYPAMVAVAGVAAGAAAADMDFSDFRFDDEPAQDASPAAEASGTEADALDQFDFSLDDFEAQLVASDEVPAAPAAAEEPTAAAPADDFTFDLDALESLDKPAAEDASSFDFALPEDKPLESEADRFSFDLESLEPATETAQADLGEFDFALPDETDAAPTLPEDFDLSLEDEAPKAAPLDDAESELDAFARQFDAEPPAPEVSASPVADLDGPAPLEDDFDFLAGADETTTKLDLERAYIEMGDADGARDILDEIMSEGNETQKREAREMLTALS